MASSAESRTLGELLRRYRQAAGLTQEELAARSGLSVRAIGDLERDRRRAPRKDTISLLAQALGLTAEERAAVLSAVHRPRRTGALEPEGPPDVCHAVLGRAPLALPLTPLIGREREEAAVIHLLTRGDVRLLTLTGPAGVGKTRLAAQVATTLQESYGDGANFVELAAIQEAERVLSAIAQAVDVREGGGQPLRDALITTLRKRESLLVLDNFEQVLSAAITVVDLLQACPQLKVLVTSRAVLNVRGEHILPVPPLEMPDPHHLPTLADLERYASVALFIQRARAKLPTFTLATEEDGRLVAAICRALDGLPLGIELAAARITLLPLRALHDRLRDQASFMTLTGGARDAPERHQSLATAIGWSHDLLNDDERRLFRRLSVFMGGATIEAVEAVCKEQDESSLLAHLASLVDQSLVLRENSLNGEARIRMLETIHEYAWKQLETSGEAESVQQRHASYYQVFAQEAARGLWGGDQVASLARLEIDHENLGAAMRWTRMRPDIGLGLQLATALHRFWLLHGPLSEGREHLDAILSLSLEEEDPTRTTLRAWGLSVAGSLAWKQSDYDRAVSLLEEALGLARTAGEVRLAAAALHDLANVATEQADFIRATQLYAESLALNRSVGNTSGVASTLKNLAELELDLGEFARAKVHAEESLALCRQLGDASGLAQALLDLGIAARYEGEHERAQVLLEQALALHREIKNVWGIAQTLRQLAGVMQARNGGAKAWELLQESLGWYRMLADPLSFADCLESFASLACSQEQPERAVRLYATAAALREALGTPHLPVERETVEGDMLALHATLGESVFAVAWMVGHVRLVEEALAEVESM